jgi:serine/threonine protein kinase/tetratricopeptide (TPR) repeat protein
MTQIEPRDPALGDRAPSVSELIDELTNRLQAGDAPDMAAYIARYPQHAAELQRFLPAVEVLVDLGCSALRRPGDAAVPQASELGTRDLGDFRLLREIGRGGMGVVYEAEQISLGRRVALKVLPFASTLDAKQLQRFKNEAQAAAHLHHQHIVPVYATGCERGVHYYAMQFIEGQTLAQVIAELRLHVADLKHEPEIASKPLPWPAEAAPTGPYFSDPVQQSATAVTTVKAGIATERSTRSPAFFRTVARLGIQAAEALEHAHGMGVVHRDSMPANLLVDGHGQVWITDFGLAHCQSQTGLTMTGDLVGTLRYMSPEQALAKRVPIDHRTDIYSIGATLYELLTLEPVFTGKDRQELLQQIAFDEPRMPQQLNRAVPNELGTIVLKALEKNPVDRYPTAQELADDLERFLNEEPIHARRPTLVQRTRKWALRHKGAVRAASVSLFVTVLILGVGIGWMVRDQATRRAATAEQVNLALKEAELLKGQQKWREALGAVKRANAVLSNGNGDVDQVRRVQDLGKDLEMAALLDDLRMQKTHYVNAGYLVERTRADIAYAKAFADYGIDVLTDALGQVVASLKARSIREQLVVALDDWILVQSDTKVREQLLAIAEQADPDVWRNRMRQAVVANDRGALEELAARPETTKFPPASGYLLGLALANVGSGSKAVQVLSAVQQHYPLDFWLNYELGVQLLWGPGVKHNHHDAAGYLRAALVARPDYATVYTHLSIALPGPEHLEERIALNRKAIELNPTFLSAHTNLGVSLGDKGDYDGAIAAFQEAIRLKPNDFHAQYNLGSTLKAQGRLGEAIAAYKEAIRASPGDVNAHISLATALCMNGHPDEAVAAIKEAIRLKPEFAGSHNNLGAILCDHKRDYDGAIAAFQEAIRLDPNCREAHYNLGNAFGHKGRLDEAGAEYREAIRLLPNSASAYNALGEVYFRQQRFTQARDSTRRSVELLPQEHPLRQPYSQQLQRYERFIALEQMLGEMPAGKIQAANAAEGLEWALFCQMQRKLYTVAARFYADAFAAEPKLADDLSRQYRYNAACAAAMAGCGQGNDADKLDEMERGSLRQQSLVWLRADLAAWAQLLETQPVQTRTAMQQVLRHWQQDTDFLRLRGESLSRLPEAEQQPWRQLWADVEQTLRKANDTNNTGK